MYDWACLFTICFYQNLRNQQYKVLLNQDNHFNMNVTVVGLRAARKKTAKKYKNAIFFIKMLLCFPTNSNKGFFFYSIHVYK